MGSFSMSDTHEIPILKRVIPMPQTLGIPGAIRAPIANFRNGFRVFVSVMSTLIKNIV